MTPFLLCFEDHRPDGLVWAVKWNMDWYYFSRVTVDVEVETVYMGADAEQPKAYLSGLAAQFIQHDGHAWLI